MIRVLFTMAFMALSSFTALAQERVARLIGNTNYQLEELYLPNPANDANALGDELEELGFTVIKAIDTDQASVETALADFTVAAEKCRNGCVFLCQSRGQVSGENDLISTEFTEFNADGLQNNAITMSDVRAIFEAASPDVGIVILGACRNNPFLEAGQVPPGAGALQRRRGAADCLCHRSWQCGL